MVNNSGRAPPKGRVNFRTTEAAHAAVAAKRKAKEHVRALETASHTEAYDEEAGHAPAPIRAGRSLARSDGETEATSATGAQGSIPKKTKGGAAAVRKALPRSARAPARPTPPPCRAPRHSRRQRRRHRYAWRRIRPRSPPSVPPPPERRSLNATRQPPPRRTEPIMEEAIRRECPHLPKAPLQPPPRPLARRTACCCSTAR